MKTLQISGLFLMMAFVLFLVPSCTKTESPDPVILSSDPTTQSGGVIKDLGAVGNAGRDMQAVLTNQGYLFYNSDGEVSGNGAEINVRFYSGMDGAIPTGVYNYSGSPVKKAFTFGNTFLTATDNYFTGTPVLLDIASGTINVKQAGSAYDIQFNYQLTNGDSFSASYVGHLDYSDQY
jgi:hypothetical protein